MKKVKLIGGRCGLGRGGVPWAQEPGAVIDVPAAEAERMVRSGQAEYVPAAPSKR